MVAETRASAAKLTQRNELVSRLQKELRRANVQIKELLDITNGPGQSIGGGAVGQRDTDDAAELSQNAGAQSWKQLALQVDAMASAEHEGMVDGGADSPGTRAALLWSDGIGASMEDDLRTVKRQAAQLRGELMGERDAKHSLEDELAKRNGEYEQLKLQLPALQEKFQELSNAEKASLDELAEAEERSISAEEEVLRRQQLLQALANEVDAIVAAADGGGVQHHGDVMVSWGSIRRMHETLLAANLQQGWRPPSAAGIHGAHSSHQPPDRFASAGGNYSAVPPTLHTQRLDLAPAPTSGMTGAWQATSGGFDLHSRGAAAAGGVFAAGGPALATGLSAGGGGGLAAARSSIQMGARMGMGMAGGIDSHRRAALTLNAPGDHRAGGGQQLSTSTQAEKFKARMEAMGASSKPPTKPMAASPAAGSSRSSSTSTRAATSKPRPSMLEALTAEGESGVESSYSAMATGAAGADDMARKIQEAMRSANGSSSSTASTAVTSRAPTPAPAAAAAVASVATGGLSLAGGGEGAAGAKAKEEAMRQKIAEQLKQAREQAASTSAT